MNVSLVDGWRVAVAVLVSLTLFGLGCTDDSERGGAPSRAVVDVEQLDPDSVAAQLHEILMNPDVLERTAALSSVLSQLGPESLASVREAYDSVFMDLGELELLLLAEWWARFDPQAALDWSRTEWRAENIMVTYTILRAWGRQDPQAAMEQIPGASTPRRQREYMDAVLSGWEESPHPGLLEYVEGLGESQPRQFASYVIARRKMLRDGAEATFRWAEALPDDDRMFKLNLYRRIVSVGARVDLPATLEWTLRQLEGPYADGLPQRLGQRWAREDGRAALEWLESLPPGQNRDDGVREAFRTWMKLEPAGAEAFLQERGAVPWLDPAISIWAKQLSITEPETAVEWAIQLTEPELRNGTVTVAAREWLLIDEAAANAWLDAADLPPEVKQRTRNIPDGIRKRAQMRAERAAQSKGDG
jgi:hypothetical protein